MASIVYMLLIIIVMSIFSGRDIDGYFTNTSFLMFGIVYQIPISIINSFVLASVHKKLLNEKIKINKRLLINIPLLWFPLSVIEYFVLYWKKKRIIKIKKTPNNRCFFFNLYLRRSQPQFHPQSIL